MYQNTRSFRNTNQLFRERLAKMSHKKSVDVSRFVKKATFQEEVAYTPVHLFADFQVDARIKENITSKGYTVPTPIQDQVIEPILSGRDVIGIANTGTGKTAAFLIPLIHKVSQNRNERVLIIAPTRELALQIEDELISFAKNMGIYSSLCIGGASLNRQIQRLRNNPQFVIGTPGRLRDLNKQRKLVFSDFNTIVLDEVDRMLDMGFIKDINIIISNLPQKRHSLFFSATIPPQIQPLMKRFLTDPITISVKTHESSQNVNQDIVRTNGKPKIDILHDLLISEGFEKVLIFGRTKWGIEKLTKMLTDRGFKAASIHGNKKQSQRQKALSEFKNSQVQILLATDIASRGIDVPDVTHVINYDMPESYEDYVHRIGRTGRASKVGTALTFVD